MIEVRCSDAEIATSSPRPVLEVELDGFIVGRCCSAQPSPKPCWEDAFLVMSTGRLLRFRVFEADSCIGECSVDLQAALAQQDEGLLQLKLDRLSVEVGTLRCTLKQRKSPTASSITAAQLSPGSSKELERLWFKRQSSQSHSPQAACSPTLLTANQSPSAGSTTGRRRMSPRIFGCGLPPRGSRNQDAERKYPSDPETFNLPSRGISPASPFATPTPASAVRPTRSRSSFSGGSERSPGSRLNFTAKAHGDLVELMRSKDKLRHYAERPFKARSLPAGSRLGYPEFRQALKQLLQELHISVPVDSQMQALFDKHRGSSEGVGSEEFEALLFRLLCFLRASEEVRVSPSNEIRASSEERDKRWRQEFLQKNPRRFSDVYENQKQLGKGSFGTVFLVTHRTQVDRHNSKRVRVCKMISKTRAREAKTPESKVREEFAVLKHLDHPHVLRIFEDFEDDSNFYLVMEQCRGGDLGEFVKHLEPMDAISYEFWVAKVMQHTLSAIAYCHSKAVIHKDLKPENVMLSTSKATPVEEMHVVVVDFGLSEVFSHPSDRSDVVSGTPPYMAPEVWQGNFSKGCDIWSAGCMLFFLLSGRLPFVAPTVKEFPKALQLEPEWAAMGGATLEAQQICRHMLQKMEHQRPTAQSCLRDKWFVRMGLSGNKDVSKVLDSRQIKSLLSVCERSEFEKFMTRFIATQIDASHQTRVNEAFRVFDADGDGHLSLDELRQGLLRFGTNPTQVDQVVNELDVGSTGQVSYTEFLAGIISLREQTHEEQDRLLWIAWEQFNPDSNGKVKVSSIQDALATRGMTVADMPDGFLAALNKEEHTGMITFDAFKTLLLSDGAGGFARSLTGEKQRGPKFMRWLMQKLS